jgi:hypothetical protein
MNWFRFMIISDDLGPISQGATAAVVSQGGLKQHKVEKATELPPLFEVGRRNTTFQTESETKVSE